MLNHPAVRPFVFIPLLINVLIFASLIVLTLHYVTDLMNSWMASLPSILSFLEWILWPLVVVALALVTGYLCTAVALVIASPFNGLLAEKVEELVTGKPVQGPEGFAAALAMVPRSVLRELRKLLYYLPMALLVLVISIIPGVNAVAPPLWFLLGAWMMSIEFVDYPMDNHQLGFKEVTRTVADRRLSSMGFGGLVAFCASIPLVNFFVVPAAVIGATLLWCEELAPEYAGGEAPRLSGTQGGGNGP